MKAFIKDIGNVEMLITDLFERAEKLSTQFEQHIDEINENAERIESLDSEIEYLTAELSERDETIEDLKKILREMLPDTADRVNLLYSKGIEL